MNKKKNEDIWSDVTYIEDMKGQYCTYCQSHRGRLNGEDTLSDDCTGECGDNPRDLEDKPYQEELRFE